MIMYIDVVFSPLEFSSRDFKNKSVVVIDVLRATTSLIYAFWGYKLNGSPDISGCSKIIPVETLEDAKNMAEKYDRSEILLTGERFCLKPEGFDLGNSPSGYTPERVHGKTIIFTTTNGTRALKMAESAKFISTASFVNATAAVNKLYNEKNDVIILCAGRSNKTTKEDSACAGLIANLLTRRCLENEEKYELSDSADVAIRFFEHYKSNIAALLKDSEAGQNLVQVDLEKDIYDCAKLDFIPLATKFENGVITIDS